MSGVTGQNRQIWLRAQTRNGVFYGAQATLLGTLCTQDTYLRVISTAGLCSCRLYDEWKWICTKSFSNEKKICVYKMCSIVCGSLLWRVIHILKHCTVFFFLCIVAFHSIQYSHTADKKTFNLQWMLCTPGALSLPLQSCSCLGVQWHCWLWQMCICRFTA